ncbi:MULTISPECIES: acetate/propionate family kinase [unclassified Caballeronia]|uniref:acetate/propionate family kinase n=1 Tax=unclassified Caballeronia TaxID=2646786 RepID=UPI002858FDA2|nr:MULTISPECIES: acetate/propionate family kinase [unclassified Caballeronia]MDR5777491.1 acetate/propionate family kinase [Caballeronia sp. LZ002]MDR5798552.1 acetate/propionate family kinase [Caballeronia sp. LZ001]MDR5852909.1 acetate/propionate family kinase [Caballeronia sp. LZ003]
MSAPLLLTFNPGSSTIKIGLFRVASGVAERMGQATIDFRETPLRLHLTKDGERADIALTSRVTEDLHDVLDETLGWFATHFALDDLASVGHRVVHGGDRFTGPVAIDDDALAAITALIPLAPLHQPQSVRLIRAIRHLRPRLLQSASFDTAFHATQTDLVRRFALPRALFDEGIKRYGFHGLSYRFVTERLAQTFPRLARGKVIAVHLGSGASLAAFDAGISRDSSMGFSTLDGIPMATRCGALDAGVVLHLLEQRRMAVDAVEYMLYRQSGLLGVSGISADSRELQASDRPEAREALALFAFRIAGEAARLAATLGGIDTFVFTAGIGEHQPQVRSAVCERLAWLGVELDPQSNAGNARVISSARSRVTVLVMPTDEEQIIADETVAVHHREESIE